MWLFLFRCGYNACDRIKPPSSPGWPLWHWGNHDCPSGSTGQTRWNLSGVDRFQTATRHSGTRLACMTSLQRDFTRSCGKTSTRLVRRGLGAHICFLLLIIVNLMCFRLDIGFSQKPRKQWYSAWFNYISFHVSSDTCEVTISNHVCPCTYQGNVWKH